MIAGQTADLAWEGKQADAETILYIHSRKTGAIISACVEAGAILGGAPDGELAVYSEFGARFGFAFQIRDDILDVTATEEELGKPARSDEKNKKNTYVTVFGMEKARADYNEVSGQLKTILDKIPYNTDALYNLTKF